MTGVFPPLDRDAPAALFHDPTVSRLADALGGPGEEIRIVGGAVRNALVGRPVHEIDLATTTLPAETARRAKAAGLKAVPTGAAHGTVTVVVAGTPFEVTTLREDVETDGRHAIVRFGRDFAADAHRRDFTINALSVARDGTLHDHTGGLADLEGRRVRFIGDARTRIREDFLRTLRFFRFSAEYAAGPIDRTGLDATIRERDGLGVLSRERIGAELGKLLAAPAAPATLAVLGETGLLARLVGGLGDPARLRRAAQAGRDGPGRLAAAFVTTTEDADRLRERLRLPNAVGDRLVRFARILASLRSRPVVDVATLRREAAERGLDALFDAVAALAGEPSGLLSGDASAQLARFRDGREAAPVFPLGGRDFLARGVPPGPDLGRILGASRAAWLAAGCPGEWEP